MSSQNNNLPFTNRKANTVVQVFLNSVVNIFGIIIFNKKIVAVTSFSIPGSPPLV